jgi:endonuclease/exonuclease/phosphatase family metal-dependent hydrolase
MPTQLRIATFNLENLDDKAGEKPSLAERIAVMRPQLARLRADILCLQEVNGQEQPGQPRQLSALEKLLQGTPYAEYNRAHTATTENQPYDVRNLVILSRFPIIDRQQIRNSLSAKPLYRPITAIPAESEAKEIGWERPLLKVTIDLGNGRKLHLVNLHLKSKIPSDIAGQKSDQYTWRTVAGWAEGYFISSMKRVGQALETRILIDSIFDAAESSGETPFIAVCGDFNADLDDVPIHAIRGQVENTGNPALLHRIMAPCELTVPEPARYSLMHLGKGNMLDHIIVSRPLLQFYRGTEIHNELLPDESGAFRTDVQFPESDHAPVVGEFQLP